MPLDVVSNCTAVQVTFEYAVHSVYETVLVVVV